MVNVRNKINWDIVYHIVPENQFWPNIWRRRAESDTRNTTINMGHENPPIRDYCQTRDTDGQTSVWIQFTSIPSSVQRGLTPSDAYMRHQLRPSWWAPSHYLNQWWNIVNWTHRNKLQLNCNQNSYISIQENAFENVVWKIAATLTRPQCVNNPCW